MTSFPLGVTCGLLREAKAGQDEYGNDVLGATVVEVPGCAYWPADGNGAGANELTDAADIVRLAYTVVMPPGTEVRATDRVRLPDGTVWDVVGAPLTWQSPFTGARTGVQLTLGRVV